MRHTLQTKISHAMASEHLLGDHFPQDIPLTSQTYLDIDILLSASSFVPDSTSGIESGLPFAAN